MNNCDLVYRQIDILMEMNAYINCLYHTGCPLTRNMILDSLRERLRVLGFLSHEQCRAVGGPQPYHLSQPAFPSAQLSYYNGKNGRPAYIAINGAVYDVTDSAAWAAATHFGLTAGKDLTEVFHGCHQGQQQILNALPAVGWLAP